MSRTKKGAKCPSHEYWSRRPYNGHTVGKETKRICHQIERAIAKRDILRELDDL